MSDWIERVRALIVSAGHLAEEGLSDAELAGIESDLGFSFPPDLRELLSTFVPAGEGFPTWRNHTSPEMLDWLDEPAAGVEFDVEENGFWMPSWGTRPDDDEEAADDARRYVSVAPVLIPLFSHRYLPAVPAERDNPVLSVVQTDAIIWAPNLAAWAEREFGEVGDEDAAGRRGTKEIEFWSALTERNT